MTLEERYEALDKLVRKLEDGFAVEAALAERHRMRHEQWLEDHERSIERHNRAMDRHDRAMEELDEKLARIAEMMGFRPGNGNK